MKLAMVTFLGTLWGGTALGAGFQLEGDVMQIAYWKGGTWNWEHTYTGMQFYDPSSGWVDVTYPGSPWQQITLGYALAGTEYSYGANYHESVLEWTMTDEADLSGHGLMWAWHAWEAGDFEVEKEEVYLEDAEILVIRFAITNTSTFDAVNVQLMHAFDPDQDSVAYASAQTYNDVEDLDGDGVDDWVEATGPYSGTTVGYGICDPDYQDVGVTAWDPSASATFTDPDTEWEDATLHIRHTEERVVGGETVEFRFVYMFGLTEEDAENNYIDLGPYVCEDDHDADGYASDKWGGDDCDDTDDAVNPGVDEVWYDGDDADCDDGDDYDADGDGYYPAAYASDADEADCDDNDEDAYPGAEEVWYDGVDQDCEGDSDYDADADGHNTEDTGGTDCDDADDEVNPDAEEVWYDGTDGDCDGASDYDADEDGYNTEDTGGTDCDDADADAYPDAEEIWYDGVDQDCAGDGDYDADDDGYNTEDTGGADCDDSDDSVNPDGTETWYDGVDQDCDDTHDYDADGDGFTSEEYGGPDCDDADDAVYPGADDEPGDGIDQDCDGKDEPGEPGDTGEPDDTDTDTDTDTDDTDIDTDTDNPDVDTDTGAGGNSDDGQTSGWGGAVKSGCSCSTGAKPAPGRLAVIWFALAAMFGRRRLGGGRA